MQAPITPKTIVSVVNDTRAVLAVLDNLTSRWRPNYRPIEECEALEGLAGDAALRLEGVAERIRDRGFSVHQELLDDFASSVSVIAMEMDSIRHQGGNADLDQGTAIRRELEFIKRIGRSPNPERESDPSPA